jgi:pimeloyl-ACP methyl ester carboxylesterase/uncharacterized protein YukE
MPLPGFGRHRNERLEMAFLGANPLQLDDAAKKLEGSAQQIRESRTAFSSQLTSAYWQGPEAQRFHERWLRYFAPRLTQNAYSLDRMARTLRADAAEQRRVSEATGGIGGGGGGSYAAPAPNGANEPNSATTGAEQTDADANGDPNGGLNGGSNAASPAERIAANRMQMERDLAAGVGDTALLKKLLDSNTQVILYNPAAGQIAIVHGNIATADTVIITVPGTGTTMSNYADGGIENRRALDVQRQSELVSGQQIAVIAWLGYSAPQWNISQNPGMSSMAIDGGKSLASFSSDLALTEHQRLTVIGHSYGSTVVGYALQDGLQADNIIVLGSPGMSVNSVGDLNAKKGADVFAMRSTLDPVGGLGSFGTEPTSPAFGAKRLPTSSDALFTHSDYWNSTDLNQIALAATDGKANVVSTPQSLGEWVVAPTVVIDGFVNRGIDTVQEFVPAPLDGLIDEAQHVSQTVTGLGTTLVTEVVDVSVEGAEFVVEGLGAAGGAVLDGAGTVLDAGGDFLDDVSDWIDSD